MNTKPYNDLNTYLRKRFGHKVYKIALSGGMTCPNRDGTCGTKGCIFCSEGGSGDFAAPADLSIKEQIEYGKNMLAEKLEGIEDCSYIAYFQSYTNTYADPEYLRRIYREAIQPEEISALSIATRPDCIDERIIEVIREIAEVKPVMVELGLQTIHEKTARYIRRGYGMPLFEKALMMLKSAGIETIVHLIIGLPDETPEMILQSAEYVGKIGRSERNETYGKHMGVDGVKLQLLHVMKGTDIGEQFVHEEGFEERLHIRTPQQYINLLADILEILPEDMVIHRLTGDAPHEKLLYPEWSANKRITLNGILREMKDRGTCQGCRYKK